MSTEKRQLSDRRKRPTPLLSRYSIKGRRKKARRSAEGNDYYIDQYELSYLILTLSILILCFLDAYFTVNILQLGGVELNPLMSIIIYENPVLSFAVKYLITACSVIFILIHKNFKIFGKVKSCSIIYLVFSVYSLLILFEIYLLITIVKI